MLLEALERRRNASALLPLPHEKGSFGGTCFSMKNQSMSFRLVGACRDLVGTCRDLSGLVGTCWDLLGGIGNVDFMESQFEGIAIVVDKISAEFPIPEILRSVPGTLRKKNPGMALST